MGAKLYVGNLAWKATDDDLRAAFADMGQVEEAKVVVEKETSRSKGFGFVTMADEAGAERAVKELQGCEIKGRTIRVDFARKQQ